MEELELSFNVMCPVCGLPMLYDHSLPDHDEHDQPLWGTVATYQFHCPRHGFVQLTPDQMPRTKRDEHGNKIDLTPEQIAELLNLDPNIGALIEMVEDLPYGGAHYFYMRNLLASYIKVLGDRKQLREAIWNIYEWTAGADNGWWIEERIDEALRKADIFPMTLYLSIKDEKSR